jgi:hypothetical protein
MMDDDTERFEKIARHLVDLNEYVYRSAELIGLIDDFFAQTLREFFEEEIDEPTLYGRSLLVWGLILDFMAEWAVRWGPDVKAA